MSTSSAVASLPWVEKYRPKKLDDISHQEEVVDTLRNTLHNGNQPHLLFYGPPGTGKTSTILAVARDLFGPELMKTRVLELNASHERGIDVIREKVKGFAQVAIGSKEKAEGYPSPPFKIIILDEADSMTRDAQSALRRIMENYSKVTRFCIICNYVSRIIEPITSRCSKFRYKNLHQDSMLNRLKFICEEENILAEDNVLQMLITVADGDMRKGITLLQTACKLLGNGNVLTETEVVEVSGTIPSRVIRNLIDSAISQDTNVIRKVVHDVVLDGYPGTQILQKLVTQLMTLSADKVISIGDIGLSQVCIRIAEAERRLIDGASEEAQLEDVLSVLTQALAQKM